MARYSKSKRQEAQRLYLTEDGPTVAEIARLLKTKPHTIALWKKEGDWDGFRLKIARRESDKLVELLASERVNLNARHYKFWDVLGSRAIACVQGSRIDSEEVKSLDRLTAMLERMQKGQRLARGLSLDGHTEEQIRARFQAESRGLVELFIDLVKKNVPDERVRDLISQDLLERLPRTDEEEGPTHAD